MNKLIIRSLPKSSQAINRLFKCIILFLRMNQFKFLKTPPLSQTVMRHHPALSGALQSAAKQIRRPPFATIFLNKLLLEILGPNNLQTILSYLGLKDPLIKSKKIGLKKSSKGISILYRMYLKEIQPPSVETKASWTGRRIKICIRNQMQEIRVPFWTTLLLH